MGDEVDAQLDRIEREIEIAASPHEVWELIRRPGWWINDGVIVDHETRADGDVTIVRDLVHGEFAVRTVALDAPTYAAFRWPSEPGSSAVDPRCSTLVELRITEQVVDPAHGPRVVLSVVETGFASLDVPPGRRRSMFDDNSEGWELELAAARAYCDRGSFERSVHVRTDVDRAWRLVTEPEHVARWHMLDSAVIEPRVGGAVEFVRHEDGTRRGRSRHGSPVSGSVTRSRRSPVRNPAPPARSVLSL